MSLCTTTLGGRPLRLHVPDGAAPPRGWPLLILLDGDWVWPLQPPPAGLARCAVLLPGHGPQAQARARRALDYTPPADDGGTWPDPRQPQWLCGGAAAFLDELCGPALRWARSRIPLDPARISLYGHSYGGLFTLHALLHRPDAWAHLICASPSLWWQDAYMIRRMGGLRDRPPRRPVRLVLMAGAGEQWHSEPPAPGAPDARPPGRSTLPALHALANGLQGIPNLDLRLEILPGLSHGATLPASARRAVELAGEDPP